MKKIALFSLFAALLHFGVSAQLLERGNFMVGSTIGFSTANSKVTIGDNEGEGLSAQQVNIAPAIGFFVLDNFALGLGADYTLNSVTEPGQDKTTDSDLLFGPFARYYFPMGDNVALFMVANFGFGNSTDEQIVGENKQSIETNVFAIGAGPGLTVYSKGGFAIETTLKYNYANSKFDTEIGGVTSTTKTRTNQFAVALGFQYYFGGFRGVRG
jgi:hypothetical protein